MVTLATGPYFFLEAAEMAEPQMILQPCNKPHLLKESGDVPWDTVPLLLSIIHPIARKTRYIASFVLCPVAIRKQQKQHKNKVYNSNEEYSFYNRPKIKK